MPTKEQIAELNALPPEEKAKFIEFLKSRGAKPSGPSTGDQLKDYAIDYGKKQAINQGASYAGSAAGMSAAQVSGYLMAAKAAYDLYKIGKSDMTGTQKAQSVQETAGRAFYVPAITEKLLTNSSFGKGLQSDARKLDAEINPVTRLSASLFGEKKYRTEPKALFDLASKGTYVPESVLEAAKKLYQGGGRSKEELIKRATDSGGNVKFAESRSEADLTPEDIVGYSAFAKKDPEWFRKPLAEQLGVAKSALDAGAVNEHHGTVDIDWDKIGEAKITPGETSKEAVQRIMSAPSSQGGVDTWGPQNSYPLQPGEFKNPNDPSDPNRYWRDPKTGQTMGTLIGWQKPGSEVGSIFNFNKTPPRAGQLQTPINRDGLANALTSVYMGASPR